MQLARSLPRNTAALRTGFRMRVEAAAIITNTQVWRSSSRDFQFPGPGEWNDENENVRYPDKNEHRGRHRHNSSPEESLDQNCGIF